MLSQMATGSPGETAGQELSEARMAAGYRSQEEFSALLSLHRKTVTKLKGGTRRIKPEILHKRCKLCHVDCELNQRPHCFVIPSWQSKVTPRLLSHKEAFHGSWD